jgi:hypothetical protein
MDDIIVTKESAMVRMQIQFTEDEVVALRREAAQRSISVSAVVRAAVDQRLSQGHLTPSREELARRSLAAMGRFHSGTGDVSARHDEYFADSILD